MAELVGLVSAITALVGTGYKIAKTISDCVDELGTAADQMMLIAIDTKAMTRIFQELKIRLKNSKKVTAQVLSLAEEIVELGQKSLRNVEECLLPLMPQIGKGRDPMRKARWLFAKSKITSRRASLDSLKLTMTLLLHAVDRAWGDADEADTKEEIEKLLVSAKDTKMNFIKAEIFDQAVEHQYEPNDEDKDLLATPTDDGKSEGKRLERPDSSDSEIRDSESCEISPTQRSMTSGNGLNYSNVDLSQWAQKHGPKTRRPLEIMPMPSDDQFIEIADHLKVQMAVARYAQVIISDLIPGEKPTSSIDNGFYEASSKWSAEDQSIVQSEGSVSDGEMESITDASETMGDRPGSSWKFTLPNREHVPRSQPNPRGYENKPANPFVPDARQSEKFPGTFPGGAYYERPPMTPQYGYEQYPHINAQTYPQSSRFPGDYLQQTASFPYYYDTHWNRNVPSPPNSTRQPARAPPRDDPEKIAMQKQLAEIKAAEEKREAEIRQRELETRIREETERAFKQKMMERDRQDALLAKERADATEKAKMEIEEARLAAEKATRNLMEKEREAAEERKKEEAAAIARAQQAARDQMEAERRAEEKQKKLEADAVASAQQAAQLQLKAEMAAQAARKDTKGSLLSFWKRSDR
ncbi:hypothetical protein G7054_g4358 [Neopestalotiopsis clavispora]|nr:hypothetical protein G7054_g4358 [Neopestalotiopsis clavispora]